MPTAPGVCALGWVKCREQNFTAGYTLYNYVQWGKKVFSQPPIVQVLPLKKMREACNFHHRYTSTMRDKIRKKNPENHIVGFLKNLFANDGGIMAIFSLPLGVWSDVHEEHQITRG